MFIVLGIYNFGCYITHVRFLFLDATPGIHEIGYEKQGGSGLSGLVLVQNFTHWRYNSIYLKLDSHFSLKVLIFSFEFIILFVLLNYIYHKPPSPLVIFPPKLGALYVTPVGHQSFAPHSMLKWS